MSFTFLLSALAQQPAAHPPGDWIKSGVIYEVNPARSPRPETSAVSSSASITSKTSASRFCGSCPFLPFYKQLIATRRAHPALQQGETGWVGNGAPDHVLTFFRHGAGEEYFVAINVSNQPYAGVADAPAGEYLDETPGLDDATGKKISLPALVLKAWDFRI